MNEDTEARIALHVRIDLFIDIIDAPDEDGVVWCEGPYDVELPATETLPITTDDDGRWLAATLVGIVIGMGIGVVVWFILMRLVALALGTILWLMVSSVS